MSRVPAPRLPPRAAPQRRSQPERHGRAQRRRCRVAPPPARPPHPTHPPPPASIVAPSHPPRRAPRPAARGAPTLPAPGGRVPTAVVPARRRRRVAVALVGYRSLRGAAPGVAQEARGLWRGLQRRRVRWVQPRRGLQHQRLHVHALEDDEIRPGKGEGARFRVRSSTGAATPVRGPWLFVGTLT